MATQASTPIVLSLGNDTVDIGVSKQSNTGIDRFDYEKMWSLRIGDYFMPLSQEFTIRAKKRLNVSALVDGIDIIQQTRKEAKMIECSMRFTLRQDQPNLTMVKEAQQGAVNAMDTFSNFLRDFYDNDAVLEIHNKTINETFGVRHVFISEYRFTPKRGATSFQFDFTLTEVIYGDDVLTFDVREIIS